ncbi:RNA helicase required for poly(A+) mRNA export, partial [Irineochytrium annulatum]
AAVESLVKGVGSLSTGAQPAANADDGDEPEAPKKHGALVDDGENVVEIKLADLQADVNNPLYSGVSTFEDLNLHPNILKGLYTMGFNRPSKIQERALPMLLATPARNMIGQSQSGTGKTAAFALTMLSKVTQSNPAPQAICLAPARELARQIHEVVSEMGKYTPTKIAFAIKDSVPRGTMCDGQIIIGTPGTVLEMIKRRQIDVSHIKIFVLDEADNMLDQQGLGDQSIRVKNAMPPGCQIVLFSATFTPTLRNFATRVAPDANMISLKQEELSVDGIRQLYMDCKNEDHKVDVLMAIYGLLTIGQSIIFVRRRDKAEMLTRVMNGQGHEVIHLHGGLDAAERDQAMDDFRNGKKKVLIATNVLARGIDILQVNVVINYDMPLDVNHKPDPDTYLHRIGRTGRFGRTGISINFVHNRESYEEMKAIETHFGREITRIPTDDYPKIEAMLKKAVKAAPNQSGCLGYPRNASALAANVYHTWNWTLVKESPVDPAYSLLYQSRQSSINQSYSATNPMATVFVGQPLQMLWTRVDHNDGTIEGQLLLCAALNAATGKDSTSDGGLVDMPGPWHTSNFDNNGTANAAVNYTLMNEYSYCSSKSGDVNDLNEGDCTCLQTDTGPDTRNAINTDYQRQCRGNMTIPAAWGTGTFSCVWFYQINKAGYFNRYPFAFEVNVQQQGSASTTSTTTPKSSASSQSELHPPTPTSSSPPRLQSATPVPSMMTNAGISSEGFLISAAGPGQTDSPQSLRKLNQGGPGLSGGRQSPNTLNGDIEASNDRKPNLRRSRAQAFSHLDEAKLGWFHLRAVLVAGAGFFTDAYDIFVISQALPMIYQVYYYSLVTGSYPGPPAVPYTPQNRLVDFTGSKAYPDYVHIDALLKASTNWGNLIGQLGFGYLGDRLGRKKMYGVELIIMIVCTIGSAIAAPAARGFGILIILGLWRFFLGIGIGGDYPMSAIITSEFANVRYRGMMLAAVFSMQGMGILIGGFAFLITLVAMKGPVQYDFLNLDYVWRICLGFGVIPGLAAIYFRLTIPETPRYTVDVNGDHRKAQKDIEAVLAMNESRNVTSGYAEEEAIKTNVAKKSSFKDFKAYFGQWRNMKNLIGTAYCWFALDVAWYGLSLNQSVVLGLINFNGPSKDATGAVPPHDIWDTFYQRAVGNVIIAVAGTVPGYYFSVFLIERMGRKPIQFMGFGIITIILIVLAAAWNPIHTNQTVFVTLFTIAQFFFQFGPNTTTFVIPGEIFPTRYRSTAHGIAAAAGKVGAILGIQAVGPYFTANASAVLWAFAAIMASGGLATFLLPETAGRSLEELSAEDDDATFVGEETPEAHQMAERR